MQIISKHYEYHLNQVKQALIDDGYDEKAQDEILLRLSREMTDVLVKNNTQYRASDIRKHVAEEVYPILQKHLSRPIEEVINDGK